MKTIMESYPEHTEEYWKDFTYEERYQIPLMNTIWYYPPFVSFRDEERYLCDSNTTLLYDIENEQRGVALTA